MLTQWSPHSPEVGGQAAATSLRALWEGDSMAHILPCRKSSDGNSNKPRQTLLSAVCQIGQWEYLAGLTPGPPTAARCVGG
ncbi:unnamed protein product [Arctogadus glacialis]